MSLGVPRHQVILVPHDPQWAAEYRRTAWEVARILGDNTTKLLFRDYPNRHPTQAYSDLKVKLVLHYPENSAAYTGGKAGSSMATWR